MIEAHWVGQTNDRVSIVNDVIGTISVDLLQRTKDSLRQKEVEMAGMEERYKKHIEKAKIVLQSLNTHHSNTPEVAALISQLKEKDKLIERLERETEHHKALRETEDHLVTTAFYNLVLLSHYFLVILLVLNWSHLIIICWFQLSNDLNI